MKRVLYAEDEYSNRKLLEMQLRRKGVECDLAEDGIEALELFRHHDYGVIVLDQYMPGLNGNEVATAIRREDTEIPLIAITSDDSQVPLLRASGFEKIFLKPLHGQDYIGAILKYCE